MNIKIREQEVKLELMTGQRLLPFIVSGNPA